MVASAEDRLRRELGGQADEALADILSSALRLVELRYKNYKIPRPVLDDLAHYMVLHRYELKQTKTNLNSSVETTRKTIGKATEEYSIEHKNVLTDNNNNPTQSYSLTTAGLEVLAIQQQISDTIDSDDKFTSFDSIGNYGTEDCY